MDIGKALTFISEDERYLEKLGIGVALLLISGIASFAFVGVIVTDKQPHERQPAHHSEQDRHTFDD